MDLRGTAVGTRLPLEVYLEEAADICPASEKRGTASIRRVRVLGVLLALDQGGSPPDAATFQHLRRSAGTHTVQ